MLLCLLLFGRIFITAQLPRNSVKVYQGEVSRAEDGEQSGIEVRVARRSRHAQLKQVQNHHS